MKWMIIVLLSLVNFTGISQEYRLGYVGQTLPELYDRAQVFAEVKQGGEFRKLPKNKYRLHTKDATLQGDLLTFDRAELYKNNGVIHFTLATDGKEIPLTLNLPILQEVRINLYTDSIKPILNYYLNVEGQFSNGRILPLDAGFVTVTSDVGSMKGMEWILPKERNFDKVNFTVTNKFNPKEQKHVTLYLKKYKDPRDAPDYQGDADQEPANNSRR